MRPGLPLSLVRQGQRCGYANELEELLRELEEGRVVAGVVGGRVGVGGCLGAVGGGGGGGLGPLLGGRGRLEVPPRRPQPRPIVQVELSSGLQDPSESRAVARGQCSVT